MFPQLPLPGRLILSHGYSAARVFNGEQGPRQNYTAPANFDWDKITTWAPFEVDETGPDLDQYAQMYCKAHQSGARVLAWSRLPQGNTTKGSKGLPVETRVCDVTEFYGWARKRNGNVTSQEMFNQTAATTHAPPAPR